MSKFTFNPNVKIVKSCKKKISPLPVAEQEPTVFSDIAVISDESLIENFEEESISKIESQVSDVEVQEELNLCNEVESNDESPTCLEHLPLPLTEQISLPLEDSASLYFYEVFMISQATFNDERSNRLIPKHDEINEIGSACIMAEKIDDGNVMVYINVQMLNDDENVTQEILSVVKLNLQLVHEKRIERSCVNGRFMEKSLLILADDDVGFRLIKTETLDNETETWKSEMKLTKPGAFISSAANVLLTRRLVLNQFEGSVHGWTCDMEGDVVLSQLIFLKPEETSVLDRPTKVQRVNRLLISKISNNQKAHKCSSFFHSSTSCLIKEISSDNFNEIYLNPFSEFPSKTCNEDLHLNFEKNLQLISNYLDQKEKQGSDDPRMKLIFRDYILCLVNSNPKNVMNLTMDSMRKLEREANVHQVYQTADSRHQQNSN